MHVATAGIIKQRRSNRGFPRRDFRGPRGFEDFFEDFFRRQYPDRDQDQDSDEDEEKGHFVCNVEDLKTATKLAFKASLEDPVVIPMPEGYANKAVNPKT